MTKKQKKEPSPNRKPWQVIKNVAPIRNLDKIEEMKWALDRFCSNRDRMAFIVGINTGLRAGDLLRLTVDEIKGQRQIKVKEGKTGKIRDLYLSNIYDELQEYIETLPKACKWLFPSRKGTGHITVIHLWRQLNKAAEWAGVDAVGSHTMRKTFGYFHYKQYKDIAQLQTILSHSHPEVTLRYIGINAESIEKSMAGFKL